MRLANEASPLQLDAGGLSRSETICSGSQSYQPGIAGLQRDSCQATAAATAHQSPPDTNVAIYQYIELWRASSQVQACCQKCSEGTANSFGCATVTLNVLLQCTAEPVLHMVCGHLSLCCMVC